jgi:hypothetical protein
VYHHIRLFNDGERGGAGGGHGPPSTLKKKKTMVKKKLKLKEGIFLFYMNKIKVFWPVGP